MITATPIRDGQAYLRNHLSANDYYSESETVIGHWHGKAAKMLGLDGREVSNEVFEQLRSNKNPLTGNRLTPRKPKVSFHDFVVSAPKSVSIAAMVGGDERILEAFDRCVEKTFQRLEAEACIRMRKGDAVKTEQMRRTGNAIAAIFRHDTSRLLDPQLHSHLVFANASWNAESEQWLALQPKRMGEESPVIRQQFYHDLAAACRKLGYQTENDGESFRLKEIDCYLEHSFSQRSVQRSHFEKRYQETFGEKPSKRRVEQFIKDGKRAATQRFLDEYQAQFSTTPSDEQTNAFVKDWRSSKMSRAEPYEVRDIQRSRMTPTQTEELQQLVHNARARVVESVGAKEEEEQLLEEATAPVQNTHGPEPQKQTQNQKKVRPQPLQETVQKLHSPSPAHKARQFKKLLQMQASLRAHPHSLMNIRLRQLARQHQRLRKNVPPRRTH